MKLRHKHGRRQASLSYIKARRGPIRYTNSQSNDVFVRSSGGGTYVKSRVSTSQARSIVGDNSDRVRAHPDRSLDRPARVWIGEADRACDLDRRTVSNGPATAQSSSAISSASSMCCVSLVTCASGTVVMAWPVSSGCMAATQSCAIGSTSSPQIVRRRLHATIIHVAVPSARNCRRCFRRAGDGGFQSAVGKP